MWLELVAETERDEDPRRVGGKLDPGANRLQPLGLFIDGDAEAEPGDRQRRGEPARPPADRLSAVSNGLSVAIGLLIMGAGGIWATWVGLRRATLAYTTRMWEREWAEVGPEWTSHKPT